jgi:hypothetical protein
MQFFLLYRRFWPFANVFSTFFKILGLCIRMPTLSFEPSKSAKPVAIVRGGDSDGDVLFLHDGDVKGKKGHHINANEYVEELRTVKPTDRVRLISRLEEAVSKGLEPDQLIGESALAVKLYERILSDKTSSKDVELENGAFELLPTSDPKKRDVFSE